jgi:hypothetical protein
LIQKLNEECINAILTTFSSFLKERKEIEKEEKLKELNDWLNENLDLKLAWIQFNESSLTIYLREN